MERLICGRDRKKIKKKCRFAVDDALAFAFIYIEASFFLGLIGRMSSNRARSLRGLIGWLAAD